jgi:transposase-like protein
MSVMEEHRARPRRSFSDEFKRDAVAMVLDDGNRSSMSPTVSVSVRARWGTGCASLASTGVSAPG